MTITLYAIPPNDTVLNQLIPLCRKGVQAWPFSFLAANAGALIEVDDQYAGGQCQCPACNALVPIPQPSVPAGPAIQSAVPPVPTPPPIPNMSPPTMPGMILPPRDPGSKGWAVAALVLGILSFCIPVILVPFVVLFGIIALILVSRNPSKYGGTGLAIAGICAGVAALLIHALFLSILLPSLARARELSKRAVCAANLKGLGTGFYTYANEQSEAWPTPFAPARGGPASPDAIDYVGAIGSYRGKAGDPNAGDINRMTTLPTQFSTTRCMWTLVRMQACTQQSFVCPSNDDSPNEEASPQNYWDFGTGDITGPATAAQVRQGWRQVSYGYQVPYGKHGQPSVRLRSAHDPGCRQRSIWRRPRRRPAGAATHERERKLISDPVAPLELPQPWRARQR